MSGVASFASPSVCYRTVVARRIHHNVSLPAYQQTLQSNIIACIPQTSTSKRRSAADKRRIHTYLPTSHCSSTAASGSIMAEYGWLSFGCIARTRQIQNEQSTISRLLQNRAGGGPRKAFETNSDVESLPDEYEDGHSFDSEGSYQ